MEQLVHIHPVFVKIIEEHMCHTLVQITERFCLVQREVFFNLLQTLLKFVHQNAVLPGRQKRTPAGAASRDIYRVRS